MSAQRRERLPNRCIGETFEFEIAGGADIETIRKALCRDSHGRASGPLGAALDRIAEEGI
jgi:hypothetical protein